MLDREKGNIDVTVFKESRMYTTLSFSAFKNHYQCFKMIYNHAIRYNIAGGEVAEEAQTSAYKKEELHEVRKKAIKTWVNTPTDERFTALHFSTYHGNI